MTNREIDRLVAEKVMGWELHEDGESWFGEDGHFKADYWWPSVSIDNAWDVAQKFTPHIRIECCDTSDYVDFDSNKKWHVDIWVEDKEVCCVTAETAPMAICLAALAAVGVEVE